MKPDEAAAYWIVRRDSRGLAGAEAAAFEAWFAIDANRQAYRHALRTWTALDGVGVGVGGVAATDVFQLEGRPEMKMTLARAMDASAIGLSALCLVHCLALPALALALPFLGAWAHAEWVHVAFICAAAPIALTALVDWRTLRPHAWAFVALAALGLGLMLAGALEVPSAGWERPLTVIGGVILATAHILNWRRRHAHHECS
jgi:hypothetical protein